MGGGHVWQGGMHGRGGGGMCGRRDGHCSGQYSSFWNSLLYFNLFQWRTQDFPEGGAPTPEFGTTTYYLTIFFAENCMQMKEIRPKGGILHRDSILTKFGYISQIN